MNFSKKISELEEENRSGIVGEKSGDLEGLKKDMKGGNVGKCGFQFSN